MSYVVEAGASRTRRARRRRALITLGIVALMLFFAFWYAYSYYQNSNTPRAASPTCTATSTATATATSTSKTPSQITVNVYNATDRAGLAAKTAADVRKRGFTVSAVSNDPLQRDIAGAAEVRYGATGTSSAKLVMALVKGAKAVKDSRTDSSVDLVLGAKFKALTAAPKATAATAPSTSAC